MLLQLKNTVTAFGLKHDIFCFPPPYCFKVVKVIGQNGLSTSPNITSLNDTCLRNGLPLGPSGPAGPKKQNLKE